MDLIEQLKSDLNKGFTKSDLERLIGLPQNSLSKVIKTGVGLSKKSEIKIQNWMVSEKPNPLDIFYQPKETKKDTIKTQSKNKPNNETSNVTETKKGALSAFEIYQRKKLGIK